MLRQTHSLARSLARTTRGNVIERVTFAWIAIGQLLSCIILTTKKKKWIHEYFRLLCKKGEKEILKLTYLLEILLPKRLLYLSSPSHTNRNIWKETNDLKNILKKKKIESFVRKQLPSRLFPIEQYSFSAGKFQSPTFPITLQQLLTFNTPPPDRKQTKQSKTKEQKTKQYLPNKWNT